jgi:hypothetical protein
MGSDIPWAAAKMAIQLDFESDTDDPPRAGSPINARCEQKVRRDILSPRRFDRYETRCAVIIVRRRSLRSLPLLPPRVVAQLGKSSAPLAESDIKDAEIPWY